MDNSTLECLRQIMYEATDRVSRATPHPDDNYLHSQFDGLLFALEVFGVRPRYADKTDAILGNKPPLGWELTISDDEVAYFTPYGDRRYALENTDPYERGFLVNVHEPDKCAGENCTIHNRSDHHMRSWPQHWRSDTGVMERTCPHGVGHPDPDMPYGPEAWQWVHGCDGCCTERTTRIVSVSELAKGDVIEATEATLLRRGPIDRVEIEAILIDGRGTYMIVGKDEVGPRYITASADARFERVWRES